MKNSVAFLLFIFTIASVQAQKNKSNLLIGTYTNKCDSKGIYVYDFDAKTGNFNFKNRFRFSVFAKRKGLLVPVFQP